MKKKDYITLVESARHYHRENVKLYISEIGWQDWMQDYLDDPEAETLGVYERREINRILLDAFEEAHDRRFSYWDRRELLDY